MSQVDKGMGKRTPFCAVVLALAALPLSGMAGPAFSGPDTGQVFFQITAALLSGNGPEALALSNTGLGQAGLSAADRSRLLLDRGLADQLQANPEAALADLTEAINAQALSPQEQARAFLERGLVLDGMNRLNDAIGDYGAVLRLTPNSPAALNNRANALRRQNRFDDARRDYLASLAADNPAPEYPYYGLGRIAESEGKTGVARNFYSRALAANPGYSLAAQRLTVLGGAASNADMITLKPPTDVITLKPPKGVAPPQIVEVGNAAAALRPPAAISVPRYQVAAQPTIKPVDNSDRDGQPGLRPALDNPGGQQVQLGAWRLEAEAAAGWDHALKAADGALSGFSPHIVAADLPGRGRYYRLRVVTPDGKQLCAILMAKGLACILARD